MPDDASTSAGSGPSCPLPLRVHETIQMAHGGGGRLMRDLIETVFKRAFMNPALARSHDSAVLAAPAGRLAFTTDSYVVSPLVFPGGDIGKLAVCGTLNDLAMAGAAPLALSAGFILEEGFPLEHLARIVESMQAAAAAAGVAIVTGDTKVVDRGKGDGVFINTAGIGAVPDGVDVGPHRVQPGDVVVLSGDVGRHGVAILSVREGLGFETSIESDCADLSPLVARLTAAGIELHCLRDLTRGGLASALNEIALDGQVEIALDERAIPVSEAVAAASELLGLDPLHVANEGRMIAIVPATEADRVLAAWRGHPAAPDPGVIGRVTGRDHPRVLLLNRLGGTRILDLLSGEQLPRIC
ncbi:MAG: hydrogenase expression/formation protein HypE [Planctomycetes bacterium]|nr:hydrogenase expression/formation protein HypE [Planctomycetota bacterium]